MPLALPDILRVRVTCPTDPAVPLDRLLIFLDCHIAERYYFGCLVGLTDAEGRAQITSAGVYEHFTLDQRMFPMDYRVPLEDCDSSIRVHLVGGTDFKAQRAQLGSGPVTPEAVGLWLRARNDIFSSATAGVDLALGNPAEVLLITTPLAESP